MTELTIIIPTYNCMQNKKNSLELVLKSIEKQNIDKNKVEIVFVDNGSSDNTLTFIEGWRKINFKKYGSLQLLFNPDLNRAKSRNMGAEKAEGDKLLFMDDDTMIYNPDALITLISDFYEKHTFFCGAQRYWTLAGWTFEEIKNDLMKNNVIDSYAFLPKGISRESGFRDLQEFSFIGNFGGLIKEDFMNVRGFDSNRFPGRQEDVDLMFRLVLYKFHCRLLSEAVKVIHLTHPITGNKKDERIYWLEEFKKKEHEEGFYFCINHLFEIFEDNDEFHPVLKRIN